jgi:hypothetical protein
MEVIGGMTGPVHAKPNGTGARACSGGIIPFTISLGRDYRPLSVLPLSTDKEAASVSSYLVHLEEQAMRDEPLETRSVAEIMAISPATIRLFIEWHFGLPPEKWSSLKYGF